MGRTAGAAWLSEAAAEPFGGRVAMGLCMPCMGGAVKDVVETPDPVSAAGRRE